MINDLMKDAKTRMQKSVGALQDELKKLRTGRAHAGLLDHVQVEYYGSDVPLGQAATVSVEDARTLSISPFEKTMIPIIEKAVLASDMGLSPVTSGSVIRVPVPPLNEERRRDMTKLVRQEGENARVAIRNIRRDILSDVKDLLKSKDITEDDDHKAQDDVQKVTDEFVGEVEKILTEKEKELMEV